jgi:glycosyltransferase involved in cell wall biosynthesis
LAVAVQNSPKIAIVCDWLIGGGAERVVYELHLLYPEAPIYTSYCSDYWRQELAPTRVITGYLQHWPFSRLRKFLPILRFRWFSKLDFSGYDIVISATGAEAKNLQMPETTKHISYIHAPTHYYWGRYEQYLERPGFGMFDGFARFGLKKLVGRLRNQDFAAAQKPDQLIANSTFTAEQIKTYYKRDSIVVHPPIRTKKFNKYSQPKNKRHGFIVVGRQTPYKQIELALQACNDLGLELTVIGSGPDNKRLRRLAGPSITFLGQVDKDNELAELIGQANAFIFPGLEDFGIAPVEALAAGTPVIAYQGGGALDYVMPGKNGNFFAPQTVSALKTTLKKFNPDEYTSREIKQSSKHFDISVFQRKIAKLVDS